MKRPPLLVVFLAVCVIALAETGGAAMSKLRPQIAQYTETRIRQAPQAHGLAGSAEYDVEVIAQTIFTIEAGLSFFHTHGEGMGIVVLLASTIVASVVPWLPARGILHGLLGASAVFPIGYLAYSALVLGYGRDRGIELAERYMLIPLGSAAIGALVLLGVILLVRIVRGPRTGAA
ncbi:MAG: hypothetical protein ACRDY4_07080 [Acidimicrobiia bacterium]